MERSAEVLNPKWGDLDGWWSRTVVPSKQFDCWRDFVIDAHLSWDIKPLACDGFPAFLRQGRFDGYRLIHLTAASGGVSGRRSRQEIAKDDEEYYNLLYVAEGALGLDFGSHRIRLDSGTFAMWDTTKPMEFDVIERLREVSFSVPKKRLHQVLARPEDYCGRLLRTSSGISRMFIDCLLALDTNFGELSSREASDVVDATTDMMVSTLMSKVALPVEAAHHKQFQHVMDFINRQIDNPCLTPRRVAREVGLSERQLFRLFATVGTTPSAWIRRQRLERCRQCLVSPASAHLSVLEVAVRWGFIDASVFSRSFRQEFGVSPRQLRSAAQAQAQAHVQTQPSRVFLPGSASV